MSSQNQDQDLYGQTYDQILKAVLGSNTAQFQLIYPFQDWNWSPASSGQISSQTYDFCSQIPEWSSIGEFNGTGSRVSDAYRNILYKIDLTVSADQQQAEQDARDQVTEAQNQVNQDYTDASTAYNTYVNNLAPGVTEQSYDEWVESSGWQATIDADEATLAQKQENYNNIVAEENPEWNDKVDGVTAPDSVYTKKAGWTTRDQGDGNLVSTPIWTLSEDPWDWATEVQSSGGNSVSFSLGSSQTSYSLSESWAEGGSDGSAWFFSYKADGEWKKMDLSQSSESLSVQISMQAVSQIQVSAGDWYDGAYLKSAADSNDFISPYSATGSTPVFGEGGILPLMITSMIVCYKPSITVTMASSSYEEQQESFKTSDGVRVGPFTFGGDGGSSSDSWTADSSSSTFSMTSDADYPFILGVIVTEPGLS